MSDTDLALRAHLPSDLGPGVQAAVQRAREERVEQRLRAEDPTLWAPAGTPEVANRLGWLTIAERMLAEVPEIESFVAGVQADGLTDVVLLGMGGSSLAPEVLRRAFPASAAHPHLHVLDSTDAATIEAIGGAVDPERTLFIVSSKSGGTIEPLSLFAHFHSLVGDGANFAAITDPGSGLAALAESNCFRHIFLGDPNIGGRYSALSPFGIVPAALIGVDVRGLLSGAAVAWDDRIELDGEGEPQDLSAGVWLGASLAAMAEAGRDKLTFLIADSLPGLGLWLEQLVAESTGKHGKGILPVADEPIADPAAYGDDRVFAYLPDLHRPDPAMDARVRALAQAGHPVIEIPTGGPADLGRIFLLAELAVAVAGWGLSINPFDQPNVQQAKDATNKVLAGYESAHQLPTLADVEPAELNELLLGGAPPHYVTLMVYAQGSPELDRALGELRVAVRGATKVTTTSGYGPRFLHSTGQFHKGGPPEGRFLQLLHDGPSDVAIPGKPFTFTTLKNAQAIGDFNTLRELGLPAGRVTLAGEDPVSGVQALTASIKEQT